MNTVQFNDQDTENRPPTVPEAKQPRGVYPLDFSFKCLCSFDDLQEEQPRTTEGKKLEFIVVQEKVLKSNPVHTFEEINQNSSKEEDEEYKRFSIIERSRKPAVEYENVSRNIYTATAIRLNNNSLSSLSDLYTTMSTLLVNPNWLGWIDLSFNDISKIDPCFSQFPELRLIYLHGNAIEKLSEVDVLKKVKKLHTLTLHSIFCTENSFGFILNFSSFVHFLVMVIPLKCRITIDML